MMGGKIGVASSPGAGSTFWFTAVFQPPRHAAASPCPEAASFDGHRALIVDDNATNRKLLKKLCGVWGLSHSAEESADAALSAMRRAAQAGFPFDLVVLDHHMPETDGLSLADAILANLCPAAVEPRPLDLPGRKAAPRRDAGARDCGLRTQAAAAGPAPLLFRQGPGGCAQSGRSPGPRGSP